MISLMFLIFNESYSQSYLKSVETNISGTVLEVTRNCKIYTRDVGSETVHSATFKVGDRFLSRDGVSIVKVEFLDDNSQSSHNKEVNEIGTSNNMSGFIQLRHDSDEFKNREIKVLINGNLYILESKSDMIKVPSSVNNTIEVWEHPLDPNERPHWEKFNVPGGTKYKVSDKVQKGEFTVIRD